MKKKLLLLLFYKMDEEYNLRVANLEIKKSEIFYKYEQSKKLQQESTRKEALKFVEQLFSSDEFLEFINDFEKDKYENMILSNNKKSFENFKHELRCLLGQQFFNKFDLVFEETSFDCHSIIINKK